VIDGVGLGWFAHEFRGLCVCRARYFAGPGSRGMRVSAGLTRTTTPTRYYD